MNDSEPILAELRKIAAWADMQRKMTKWSLISVAIVIPAMLILGFVMAHEFDTRIEALREPLKTTWYDVERNVSSCDPDGAIRIGEELIERTPQYAEGHYRLAMAYLAAGKIERAREHAATALRLFPSEKNEKLVKAIDKRMKAGSPLPEDSSRGGQ
jgi:tetratricopeptide (TPR) repeat protein